MAHFRTRTWSSLSKNLAGPLLVIYLWSFLFVFCFQLFGLSSSRFRSCRFKTERFSIFSANFSFRRLASSCFRLLNFNRDLVSFLFSFLHPVRRSLSSKLCCDFLPTGTRKRRHIFCLNFLQSAPKATIISIVAFLFSPTLKRPKQGLWQITLSLLLLTSRNRL